MKDLMIYVERIVRPVGATQGRKLRMRADLLAHLQAALEEEIPRCETEKIAIERAKLRLGDPATLTRELQQSVPPFERVMLATHPVSRPLDVALANHLEQNLPRVLGKPGAMTLGHATTLSIMANLSFVPLVMSMDRTLKTVGMEAAHPVVCFCGTFIGWLALFMTSYAFVFEAANSDQHWQWLAMSKRAATILALQVALTLFMAATIADRLATIGEVVTCAASTIAFLAIATFTARRISVARRPFDEWLTLDITE